jgi:Ca2+-binding EF-hand superfamily protein
MAAAAAIIGARRARRNNRPTEAVEWSPEREQHYQEIKAEMDKRVKLTELFKRYDSNNSGKLERDQINAILTDIDFSTPPGTPPTDDELDFIVKVGDRSGDGCIERREFENALVAWRTYTKQREQLEALIQKYDKSGSGKLEMQELKLYLTDINHGKPPTDAEVEWVMSEADFMGDGAIRMQEIMMATQSWYNFQQKKEEAAKSACCSIS